MLVLSCAGCSSAFPVGSTVRILASSSGFRVPFVAGHTKVDRGDAVTAFSIGAAETECDAIEASAPMKMAFAYLIEFLRWEEVLMSAKNDNRACCANTVSLW